MTDDPASDSPILQALQALARPAPAAKGRKSRTPAQPESRPGPPPQPAFQAQGQLPLTALEPEECAQVLYDWLTAQ